MNPIDFILHMNEHLAIMVQTYGLRIYAILLLIIFAETGFVVTPFLAFSSVGSLFWVTICPGAGVLLGEMEFVKKHFEVVILAVIGMSVLPFNFEAIKSKTLRSTAAWK